MTFFVLGGYSVDQIFDFAEKCSLMMKASFSTKRLKILWSWQCKKNLHSRDTFEDLVQMAKNSEPVIDFLCSSLSNLVEPLQKIIPATAVSKQDELETFLGGKIPHEVQIHPPTDILSKGRCKRITKNKEKKEPKKRKYGKCKQIVTDHDAWNCPNKVDG